MPWGHTSPSPGGLAIYIGFDLGAIESGDGACAIAGGQTVVVGIGVKACGFPADLALCARGLRAVTRAIGPRSRRAVLLRAATTEAAGAIGVRLAARSEEHTSEL